MLKRYSVKDETGVLKAKELTKIRNTTFIEPGKQITTEYRATGGQVLYSLFQSGCLINLWGKENNEGPLSGVELISQSLRLIPLLRKKLPKKWKRILSRS